MRKLKRRTSTVLTDGELSSLDAHWRTANHRLADAGARGVDMPEAAEWIWAG